MNEKTDSWNRVIEILIENQYIDALTGMNLPRNLLGAALVRYALIRG